MESHEGQQSTPTQDIRQDEWIHFLDQFTRENRGAHARLEILGSEIGSQVQADDLPLDGVSADTKAGEHNVSMTFASAPGHHFEHGIQNVTAIRMRTGAGESGPTLEIVSGDGTTAVLQVSRPDAFALPAAAS